MVALPLLSPKQFIFVITGEKRPSPVGVVIKTESINEHPRESVTVTLKTPP
jgi:hypothetical protein